ncbi:MAG: hypothetical protein HWE21_01400 [Cytophagia bacterium]|nr:hypothetical protein [Cytophagia bacterium]
MKKLLAIILLIGLTSITSLSAQEIIQTKVLKEIQEYNGEDFVVNVTDILFKNDHIFFSDQGLTSILKTDAELNFISKFGEQGMGPNEMEKPEFLFNTEGSSNLLVLDTRQRKLLEYSQDGKLIGSPSTLEASLIRHPFLHASVFYYKSALDRTADLKAYDFRNKKFLTDINFKGDFRESILGRDIHPFKNQFISVVNYSPPIIEMFNEEWEIIDAFDLSENPTIAKRVAYKKNSDIKLSGSGQSQVKPVASGVVIIKCSRFYKNKLYLLTSTMDGREDTIINKIFTYQFQNNTWVQKEQINLPEESSYSTFALLDNRRIVAFEWENSTIQLLELVR